MYLFRLAMASLANRRFTAILTAFAIALSVCLLLAVAIAEHMLYALLLIALIWPLLYMQQKKQRLSVPL